jgi:hypothetical protein
MNRIIINAYTSQNNQVQNWYKIAVILGAAAKVSLTVKLICLLLLAFFCTITATKFYHFYSVTAPVTFFSL